MAGKIADGCDIVEFASWLYDKATPTKLHKVFEKQIAWSLGRLLDRLIVETHSGECPIELDEQARAFEPAPPGVTQVVAATNAAESSITLPDVDVVVDLGVCKAARWDAAAVRAWVSLAPLQLAAALLTQLAASPPPHPEQKALEKALRRVSEELDQ